MFRDCFGGGTLRRNVGHGPPKQHYRVLSVVLKINTELTFAHWLSAWHTRANVFVTKCVTVSGCKTLLNDILSDYLMQRAGLVLRVLWDEGLSVSLD